MKDMNGFGWALTRMREGFHVGRTGWNGAGQFAFYREGYSVFPGEIAKKPGGFGVDEELFVRPCLMLKTTQNDVANWVPSVSDILAFDWGLA